MAAALALAAPASATAAGPLGLTDCGPAEGVHQCSGLVETWDGVPLDTTVSLPESGAADLPLVVLIHGFGNSKYEYLDPASSAYTGNAFEWARRGYAVLTYTARGLWGSCGTPEARLANPGPCAKGYIHLADTRFEVRDTQELVGRLVDEGVADPSRIAVTGDSYGGGQSLALAALRDRVMQPNGSLVPWRSPAGTPLRLAAAAPVIPWSDLIHAAAPNGHVSDTQVTSREQSISPVGVEKATVVNAIYVAAQNATGPGQPVGEPFIPGRPMGYLAPTGTDPQADVTHWVTRTDAGEPYDEPAAQEIVDMLANFHSAYYIPPARRPTPLMIASGFPDDLFPVDHALRWAARAEKRDPGAPLSLLLGDFGHQRADNKQRERDHLVSAIDAWFARQLLGEDQGPSGGVVAYVGTCPRDAEPLGPLSGPSFGELSLGRLTYEAQDGGAIVSGSGDPAVGAVIDPATGGGDHCAKTMASEAPGTARHEIATAGEGGFTVIGSPRLRADLDISGSRPIDTQLAGRLWDVDPETGEQVLVTRGVLRPSGGQERWFLYPASWRVEPGHRLELELLGGDAPFHRPSNGPFEIGVSDLRVTLPTRERRPG